MQDNATTWHFNRHEKIALAIGLALVLAFGAYVERKTALRRRPNTDLSVFTRAAWAVRNGENLYNVTESHGWHYGYPPAFAILFTPLAIAPPKVLPPLAPEEERTEANTPWGYQVSHANSVYGLHRENFPFFCIVALWFAISIALTCLSSHLLACALEERKWTQGPPREPGRRRRWWAIRALPVLACLASLATSWSRGQVDVVMLAAFSLAIYLAVNRREIPAGMFLAVPAAIKLFPALLLLFPVWRGRWRMVVGTVLGLFLSFVVLPVVTFGPGRTVELYHTWRHVLIEPALGQGTDSSRALELTQMNLRDNQSLLSFIHNLRYHHLSRDHRPPGAPISWRLAVGLLGTLILLGIGVIAELRRRDSPPQVLILCGLLIGLAMLVTPVVHHCYYLLLLPLLCALIDHKLPEVVASIRDLRLPKVVTFFMLTDMLVRVPPIGFWLRDIGVPLLTLVCLTTAGAWLLWRQRATEPQLRDSQALPNY